MKPDGLIKAVGKTLVHVTAASNLPMIQDYGLLPAADLAVQAGLEADDIILRDHRRQLRTRFGTATLNHQKPILHGTVKQGQSLDHGITREDWARQLDERVFFWPGHIAEKFAASIDRDTPIAKIILSTRRFLQLLADRTALCPINSGNFRQGGANTLRGPWIYVPVAHGLPAFRTNRQARGLVKSRDSVRELSVTGAISADDLAYMRIGEPQ